MYKTAWFSTYSEISHCKYINVYNKKNWGKRAKLLPVSLPTKPSLYQFPSSFTSKLEDYLTPCSSPRRVDPWSSHCELKPQSVPHVAQSGIFPSGRVTSCMLRVWTLWMDIPMTGRTSEWASSLMWADPVCRSQMLCWAATLRVSKIRLIQGIGLLRPLYENGAPEKSPA